MANVTSDNEIREILQKYKRVAVVGLSPTPDRPSHEIAHYLISHKYDVCGVRPAVKEVLGRPVYENLSLVPKPLEIVDVFRAPEFIPQVVDEVLKTDAKVLWLQLGISHPEAEKRAEAAGLKVISNKCILVEHKRLVR